tara:strand:+ start:85185 stop:85718 length:534 start_codon:yes stop_codon:yes gene_type:complete
MFSFNVKADQNSVEISGQKSLILEANGDQSISIVDKKTGDRKQVFVPDLAAKSYRFKAIDRGFSIKESVNTGKFKSFLEYKLVCSKESICKIQDYKCSWEKVDSQKSFDEITKKIDPENGDAIVSELFFLLLNGDKKALEFFKNKPKSTYLGASGEMIFQTHKQYDLPRLVKSGCLN